MALFDDMGWASSDVLKRIRAIYIGETSKDRDMRMGKGLPPFFFLFSEEIACLNYLIGVAEARERAENRPALDLELEERGKMYSLS